MLAPLCIPEILEFEPVQGDIDIARPKESRALLLDALEEQQLETRSMVEEALRVIEEWGHHRS